LVACSRRLYCDNQSDLIPDPCVLITVCRKPSVSHTKGPMEEPSLEWLDFSVVSPCEELVNRIHDVFVQWGVLAAANRPVVATSLPVDCAKIEFEGRTLKMSLYRHAPSGESEGSCGVCWRLPSILAPAPKGGVERQRLRRVVCFKLCRTRMAARIAPCTIWCTRHYRSIVRFFKSDA
jgi:hypothetical protein